MLSTDQGWQAHTDARYHMVYKGYVDQGLMSLHLADIAAGQQHLGNFCAVVYDSHTHDTVIRTDRYRGFPIYQYRDKITNLHASDQVFWTDSVITLGPDAKISESKIDVIGAIDISPIDLDWAIDQIHTMLLDKTQKFLHHNHLPIRVYLTGGVDSLLVYSYLRSCGADLELIRYWHVEHDWFYMMNSGSIREHWGYRQIHHWDEPCVLASGTPGDEFMLRSPRTVDLFLRHHSLNIRHLLDDPKWQHGLHCQYYKKALDNGAFDSQDGSQEDQANWAWQLCNINVNDWQHWHIGHTLTWTPLRDLEIFKLLIRLPVEQILGQIMDSEISKRLIELAVPDLTRLLSEHKNSGNVMRNLVDLYWP